MIKFRIQLGMYTDGNPELWTWRYLLNLIDSEDVFVEYIKHIPELDDETDFRYEVQLLAMIKTGLRDSGPEQWSWQNMLSGYASEVWLERVHVF